MVDDLLLPTNARGKRDETRLGREEIGLAVFGVSTTSLGSRKCDLEGC